MKKYQHTDILNSPDSCGIYLIGFEGSTKKYIGSAFRINGEFRSRKGFNSRWRRHLYLLRSNKHHSKKLQNAYNKYSLDSMYFCILEETRELARENYYINLYDSFNNGYNCVELANSMIGFNHSELAKKKMSEIKTTKMEISVKEKSEEFLTFFKKGLTFKEIRDIMSISRRLGENISKKLGISFPRCGTYRKKKVYSYDISTEKIEVHESITECSSKTGVHTGKVCQVVNGKSKSSGGYIFSDKKLTKEEFRNVKFKSK